MINQPLVNITRRRMHPTYAQRHAQCTKGSGQDLFINTVPKLTLKEFCTELIASTILPMICMLLLYSLQGLRKATSCVFRPSLCNLLLSLQSPQRCCST